MVKREDSTSGLMAGFVKEKSVLPQQNKKPEEKKAEEPVKAPEHVVHEPVENEIKGSTITMQGVSGKKITGSVIVVKKSKPVLKDEGVRSSSELNSDEKTSNVEREHEKSPVLSTPSVDKSVSETKSIVTPSVPAIKVTAHASESNDTPPLRHKETKPEADKGEEASVNHKTRHVESDKTHKANDDVSKSVAVDESSTEVKKEHKVSKDVSKVDKTATEANKSEVPQALSTEQPETVTKKPFVSSEKRHQERESHSNSDITQKSPSDRSYARPSQSGVSSDNRPYGDRPQGDRPQGGYAPRPGGGYQGGDRPQGDRPQGDRPQGDRPQGGYAPRPSGGYQGGDRPQGDRPQSGYAPRPGGGYQGGDRPQGDRPQGGYAPRPGGGYQGGDRPQGDRPQGGYAPRPGGGYQGGDRPQGDRPQGAGYAPRPSGGYQGGNRPQGDRPQGGGGYSPRPGGTGGGYQGGNRPQGDRPQGGGGYSPRPGGGTGGGYQGGSRGPGSSDRPQGGGYGAPRNNDRRTNTDEVKETLPEQPRINFAQRDAYDKEKINNDKKDSRKETVKPTIIEKDKHNKLKQQTAVLATGGVSLQDESLMDSLFVPTIKPKSRTRFPGRNTRQQPSAPIVRTVLTHVVLPESLTVKELAEVIKKTSAEVIKKLIKFGVMATVNQELDFDTATVILEEFNITTEKAVVVTEEDILFDDTDDREEDLVPRPPVVVVMGHVDHGKTSLLDRIRQTSVVTGEAGGITQHIGAYTIKLKGRNITFLDTPGHEAFTAMRARGAQVTDIAILVVAADDGVMPQTIEAINHAKAAEVQIVVAINKIDKPGANLDRVKKELSEHGIIPEEWGGTNVMVPVSAKTGENIDELLEMVLLTADLMDLKTNPKKQAKGTIIEAKLDKNKGPVATVLVQRGTLKVGDTLVTGSIIGRVRAMTDDKGAPTKKAGPSIPVEILGLPEVPEAGEIFYAVEDEKVARALAEKRKIKQREQQLRANSKMSLDTLFTQMAAGEVKDLNLIVKADVQGSVEAVTQSFEKLTNSEVRVRVIHSGVGTITETDIRLAEVSNAIVIGFNVRPAPIVMEMASNAGVDIRMYRIIYQAIEEIQAAMTGMLSKIYKEVIIGHVEIRQVFKVSSVGTIGGAYVIDGKVVRSCDIRLVRNGAVVFEGKLSSLKRFKDDVKEVASGYECGISLEKYNDIREGDILEAFEMQEVERT